MEDEAKSVWQKVQDFFKQRVPLWALVPAFLVGAVLF